MLDKILKRLEKYLKNDYDEDIATFCAEQAIASFRNKKNYKSLGWSDNDILSDMENNRLCCITDIALFRFVKYGDEFQILDNENGRIRQYKTEEDIYIAYGEYPYIG